MPFEKENQEQKNQKQDFPHQKSCKVLSYTHQVTKTIPNVDFPYVNINGNLRLRFKENFNNKKGFTFKSEEELQSLFEKFNWEPPAGNGDSNEYAS